VLVGQSRVNEVRFGPDYLKEWMRSRGFEGEVIQVERGETSSVAAESLGRSLESIVKSVLFIDEEGRPVLVILGGEKKLRQSEFARMTGRRKVRLATREEVVIFTGYPAGGVPPVGLRDGLEVYVDIKVLSKKVAFAGGGSENYVLKFDPVQLKELYPGRCMDLPVSPLS
jgi:prolyl-tRNA editing enzyme YbaK/EbsC (Cys-tRNA(Pro) deacylase)